MSSPSSPPLTLDVGARRAERRVAYVAMTMAVLAPWPLPLSAAVSLAISAALACALCIGFRSVGWFDPSLRIVRISWLADGRWMLWDGDGGASECELRPDTRVGRGIVWLSLRSTAVPGRNFYMLLMRRDGSLDELRRLIVRLRLDGARNLGRIAAPGRFAAN